MVLLKKVPLLLALALLLNCSSIRSMEQKNVLPHVLLREGFVEKILTQQWSRFTHPLPSKYSKLFLAQDVKNLIRAYVLFSCERERALRGERDDHVSSMLKSGRPYDVKYFLLDIYLNTLCLHTYRLNQLKNDSSEERPFYDLNRPQDPDGIPLITEMILRNNLGAVELLIAFNADVNRAGSSSHITPLYAASFLGYCSLVGLLLKAGADKNIRTKFGVTPLEIAVRQGHTDVQLLLSNW